MGFKNNGFAKVWDVQQKDGYVSIRMSTSYKDKNTEEYKTDFSGFAKLLGDAKDKPVIVGDRIKIISCEVKNKYNKERRTTYTDYIIWDLEIQSEATPYNTNNSAGVDWDDPDLPF